MNLGYCEELGWVSWVKLFIWQSHSQNIDRHCKVISKPRYCFLPFGKFNKVLVYCFLVFYLLSRGSFCHLENTPAWCLTSTDSFFSPNKTVKWWMLEGQQSLLSHPETIFLFFIPAFGNKSKKKGESYKQKYWSGYGIINYFYRIFSCIPSCEQFESFTGWCGKNATKTPLHLQSCFLPFEFAVHVQNLDLIVPITFPLSLHGTVSWGHQDLSTLLCLYPCTFWTKF